MIVACDSVGMNQTHIEIKLQTDIDAAVRGLVEVVQRSTLSAVESAFSISSTFSPHKPHAPYNSSPVSSRRRGPSRKRSKAELTDLCDRLYASICASPGLSMAELSSKVGVTSGELSLPAARLKKSDQIRSVGERIHTRYYPRAPKAPLDSLSDESVGK